MPEQHAGEQDALFPAPAPSDPDAAVALRHIEACYQDAVDRAQAEADQAATQLRVARERRPTAARGEFRRDVRHR